MLSQEKLTMIDVYSPEKWLHNRIYCPSNRSKQIQETHTAYSSGTQYTRQSLNEKNHAWLHRWYCLSVEPCILFFIQTLPRILCAGAVSRVSFLDLFGPIPGAINPIMKSLLQWIWWQFCVTCEDSLTMLLINFIVSHSVKTIDIIVLMEV